MKTKEKRIWRIIGLLIAILPMELFWRLKDPTSWELFACFFETLVTIPFGYAIYLLNNEGKKKTKLSIFIFVLLIVSVVFAVGRFFVLDFGSLLINAMGYITCFKVSKALALLILILDNRKYIFSQPIITVFSILFIIMILLLWYKEYSWLTI